jgi:hypothetical protein
MPSAQREAKKLAAIPGVGKRSLKPFLDGGEALTANFLARGLKPLA